MNLLTSDNINFDNVKALAETFVSAGLNANTTDPGDANARVDVTFLSTDDEHDLAVVVMTWVASGEPEILRFRTVIFDKKERDNLKKNGELWKEIQRAIQILDKGGFGCLSLNHMFGITTDYRLTMEGGISPTTLSNTVKEVAKFAQGVKSIILDEISYVA